MTDMNNNGDHDSLESDLVSTTKRTAFHIYLMTLQ